MAGPTRKRAAAGTKRTAARQNKPAATGHPSEAMSTIKRKISAIASQNRSIFIGKSSGNRGLRERFNNKYRPQGYDDIKPLYETSSENNA